MARISNLVVDLIGAGLDRAYPADVGAGFFGALQRYGVRAIFSRAHTPAAGTSVLSRISPPGWEALYAERDFAGVNYLDRELGRRALPFAWSDIRLQSPGERRLQRALVDNGFPDGLAVPWHGPGGGNGVTSLAFERLEAIGPDERRAIEMAATILHQRMQTLATRNRPARPRLSPRERDCLALIADGLADHEIAARLCVAETTVITHVRSARHKLSARTRAQAVAIALLAGDL